MASFAAYLFLSLASSRLVKESCAIAACPLQRLAFFHVPKAGGMSMNHMLRRVGCKTAMDRSVAYYEGAEKRTAVVLDAAHVTPAELEAYVHWGVGKLKIFHSVFGKNATPGAVLREWHTFCMVRNPYLRVLAAFGQRKKSAYSEQWGVFPFSNFASFMQWLDMGLASGELHWCCSPTITHFRPSTMFSHAENGMPAVRSILKLEKLDPEGYDFLAGFFGKETVRSNYIHAKTTRTAGSEERQQLCRGATGCSNDEWSALLKLTNHTNETISIVNRIYARDFKLLGYNMLLQDDEEVRNTEWKAKEWVQEEKKEWVLKEGFGMRQLFGLNTLLLLVYLICTLFLRSCKQQTKVTQRLLQETA